MLERTEGGQCLAVVLPRVLITRRSLARSYHFSISVFLSINMGPVSAPLWGPGKQDEVQEGS